MNKGDITNMENINFENARFYIEFSFCGVSIENTMSLLKYANIESWCVSNDSSIKAFGKDTCVLISPIMTYDNVVQVIEVLNILKNENAFINKTCYVHVHVYQDNFTYGDCIKLCNLTIPKERLICKALNTIDKKVNVLDRSFIDSINVHNAILSMDDFKNAWYAYVGKEDTSKCCVDFHDFFNGKGVTIKYFNGALSFEEILAYIDFSVALVQKAHNEKCKPWERHNDSNEARQFVDFLWGMGIRGKNPRFKVTRAILTQYLDGKPWKK